MTDTHKNGVKDDIIRAAGIAFGKYGYRKTTLDDIASIIKKRKTVIYYYFRNKDDIFQEVIRMEAQKLEQALMLAVEREGEPVEKLKAYVFTRMSFLEGIGKYYSALKTELYEHLQFINQNRSEFDKTELTIVTNLLKEGVKKQVFDIPHIEETAFMLVTLLKSLEIPFFGKEENPDYQTPLTHLLNMLLFGIVNKPAVFGRTTGR